MTNVLEEFKHYLRETFGEEFDDKNFKHLTWLPIFEAGWEAREALS